MPPLRALAVMSIVALTACPSEGPDADVATDYVAAMQPVVAANQALGDRFVDLTLAVNGGGLAGDALATRFDGEVLPASRALVDQAMSVRVATPELAASHMELVSAWTRRANAFTDLSRAWHAKDTAGVEAARGAIVQATEAEARSFAALNASLAPAGAALRAYPSSTP